MASMNTYQPTAASSSRVYLQHADHGALDVGRADAVQQGRRGRGHGHEQGSQVGRVRTSKGGGRNKCMKNKARRRVARWGGVGDAPDDDEDEEVEAERDHLEGGVAVRLGLLAAHGVDAVM